MSDTSCVCGVTGCDIPYGMCHCGCGGETSSWPQSYTKLGIVKGQPREYIDRHQYRPRPIDAVPFKIAGVYCRLIPLSQGIHVIVDASDYQWLMQWKWSASYYENTNSYYALRKEGGKSSGRTISMHRFILGLTYSDERTGDHENGNSLDNRRDNLRIVNHYESSQNRGMRKDNKTGFTGVLATGAGNYVAQIRSNGATYYLGRRDNAEDAYALYCAAAEKHHGQFRRKS